MVRHSQSWKQIENLILLDEMNSLGMKANKMRAILATFVTHARIDAEQVGIRAVCALPQ